MGDEKVHRRNDLGISNESEKRRYTRIPLNSPAFCRISGSLSPEIPIVVINASPEGVCFTTRGKFQIAQEIELTIQLKPEKKIGIKANVAWCELIEGSDQCRVGARIMDMPQGDEGTWMQVYLQETFGLPKEGKRILIVEDEQEMVQLLKIELEQLGYRVVYAHDGEEGYSKYVSEQPDLIILDVMLPKLNGYEVCRRIRREREDEKTPILMLTARKEDTDRIHGRVIGANAYIPKPFEIETLLTEIKRMLK